MKVFCVLAISCLVGLAASAPQLINSHYSEGSEYPIHSKHSSQPRESNPEIHKLVQEFVDFYMDFKRRVQEVIHNKVTQTKADFAHANGVGIPNVNHASISPSAIGQVDYSQNPFWVPAVEKAFERYFHDVEHPKVNANVVPKVVVSPPVIPDVPVVVEDPEIAKEQARSAKYAFSTDIQDGLQDVTHQRQEVRDGLALKGAYSYSDGFFKRTVQYEADENGYRVINEEVIPIGEGPKVKIDGAASVATQVAGSRLSYQITKDDINIKPTKVVNEVK